MHRRNGRVGFNSGRGYHAKITKYKGEVTMKIFVFKMPGIIGNVLKAIFGIKKIEE